MQESIIEENGEVVETYTEDQPQEELEVAEDIAPNVPDYNGVNDQPESELPFEEEDDPDVEEEECYVHTTFIPNPDATENDVIMEEFYRNLEEQENATEPDD